MSTGRSDTSSKRKKSTPQKFKSRKLFASSRHDMLEQPGFSRAKDGGSQENQLSILPVTLQNKENMPEKCPNGSVTTSRGRGRPKGSKNKTFPTLPTKVYDVREGKAPIYTTKAERDSYSESPPRNVTPHRGRGRPKGSTKVKVEEEVRKRSRGRPKGSKNKKRAKAALPKMRTSGEKIGRGRPRKIPHPNESNETLTPKRGRGRPKGSLNKVSSAKRLSIMSGTLEVKKRGRPKKIILLHPTSLMSLTSKRPRGRPRKKGNYSALPSDHEVYDVREGKAPIYTTKTERDSYSESPPRTVTPHRGRGRPKGSTKLSVMSDNFVVKKRGRPKKIILHHPTLMALTPKKPRGRPRKNPIFEVVQIHDHEMKSSESNTEDEDDMDSEDDNDRDDNDRDDNERDDNDRDDDNDHDDNDRDDNDHDDDDDK